MTDILAMLEFNAVHSWHDAPTKAMLSMAAGEIRKLRHQLGHAERMLVIEQAGARTARLDALALSHKIDGLMTATAFIDVERETGDPQ